MFYTNLFGFGGNLLSYRSLTFDLKKLNYTRLVVLNFIMFVFWAFAGPKVHQTNAYMRLSLHWVKLGQIQLFYMDNLVLGGFPWNKFRRFIFRLRPQEWAMNARPWNFDADLRYVPKARHFLYAYARTTSNMLSMEELWTVIPSPRSLMQKNSHHKLWSTSDHQIGHDLISATHFPRRSHFWIELSWKF